MASHETPDVGFRSTTQTSRNCLPKKDVKYSLMGNTAVLHSYWKHKPVMLLKCYIRMNIKSCFQLVIKPNIDGSHHLQKVDTELLDGS